jgi:hypothetical protein
MAVTTQPILRATPTEGGTVATSATGSAPASSELTAQQLADITQANAVAQQGAAEHETGNQFGAAATQYLEGTNDFTTAEITAEEAAGPSGTGAWGNGAVPSWASQIENGILAGWSSAPVSPPSSSSSASLPQPPAPIVTIPTTVTNPQGAAPTTSPDPNAGVVTAPVGVTQPVATPTPATPVATPPAATTSSGTSGSVPTAPSSTTSGSLMTSLLPSLLSALQTSGATGASGADTTSGTVPGDVAALNAASPIVTGSPASTTTSGPSNLEVFGIVGAIGVAVLGWFLWHKHHEAKP